MSEQALMAENGERKRLVWAILGALTLGAGGAELADRMLGQTSSAPGGDRCCEEHIASGGHPEIKAELAAIREALASAAIQRSAMETRAAEGRAELLRRIERIEDKLPHRPGGG